MNQQKELKSKVLRAAYFYDVGNYKDSNTLAKNIITSECENVFFFYLRMKIIVKLWPFIFCKELPKLINMKIQLIKLWNKKTYSLFKKMYLNGLI